MNAAGSSIEDFENEGGSLKDREYATGGFVNQLSFDTFSDTIGDPKFLAFAVEYDRQEKWDKRFLTLAEAISTFSKDPSTKVGAIIVRPDLSIASVGFNGFPRGCDDDKELYNDRPTKYARVIHGEMNAILQAKEDLTGYTLYTHPPGWGPSCDRCSAHIIQAGIKRVVHYKDESDFASRWKEPAEVGLQMYREAEVEVVSYIK